MRGAVIHGATDVRFEEGPDPAVVEPTDAVIRTVAARVCGSDLSRYRGVQEVTTATPIGHEYVGIVDRVGRHHHREPRRG
jgi:threonine dehydrogenase-like Zn-dependent dehydrogenase